MGEGIVLVVDDDEALAMVLSGLLAQAGIPSRYVTRGEDALAELERAPIDAIVSDLRMPGIDGFRLLEEVSQRAPDIPVVLITAHGSVPLAVEAMKAGAADFLLKPFDREEVIFTVQKAIAQGQVRHEPHPTRPPVRAVKSLDERIARAAKTNATVLLRGESGTGKEVAARRIHEESDRAKMPFIAVHAASLPELLIESELFGYERGAFTGATGRKPGRVALAQGGTLFLDEIGDVSLSMQVKLLRLLQEKEYQPLGASKPARADVRFVAATHKDLEAMVARNEFRQDLYYRLNVLPIVIPPLRERRAEIPDLVRGFLAHVSKEHHRSPVGIDDEAMALLVSHAWPGNVRELENAVERLVVFSDSDRIGAAMVAAELSVSRPQVGVDGAAPEATGNLEARRKDAERAAIEEALRRAEGNRSLAARLLGISRRTLYNKLGTTSSRS
jgi:DNA-binding NtrC family response regulator